MTPGHFSRRDFLKVAVLSAGSLGLGACGGVKLPLSGSKTSTASTPTAPDLIVDLAAGRARLPILPGAETPVWHYRASLSQGPPAALQELEGSFLGPVFRVRQGQRVQVKFKNELPDPTIIHWHGLRLPEEMDGHPRYAVASGKSYNYDFTVRNRAGTYWFHPHPHQQTGPQVYFGLAGLFIVSDDEEQALGLPSGEFDLPLVIQDRLFDANNKMEYPIGGMMEQMNGVLGDTILVNGSVNAGLDVKPAAYRLRLLNGSNSRIYKLAWQDSAPLAVIATDGGLLAEPVYRAYVMLAPGERVDLWVDFSRQQSSRLVSLPFDSGTGSMMGGMMGASGLLNGAALDILSFKVSGQSLPIKPLPSKLAALTRFNPQEAVNSGKPRTFRITMQGMVHALNGRLFEMDAVAADEKVRLGDLEIWEFANLESGGMGMSGMGMGGMMDMQMPHPMHVHGVQFQVLERQVDDGYRPQYDQVSAGFVDEGWKDTILVMPGERVRVAVRFEDYPGTYLYHCHNLEHEDAGMMRNFLIQS